jgi:hypothetical protein
MVLSDLLESIVINQAKLELNLAQRCQHSIQILDELISN